MRERWPEWISAAGIVKSAAAICVTAALERDLCSGLRLSHRQRFSVTAAKTVSIVGKTSALALVHRLMTEIFYCRKSSVEIEIFIWV